MARRKKSIQSSQTSKNLRTAKIVVCRRDGPNQAKSVRTTVTSSPSCVNMMISAASVCRRVCMIC
jgi:hypothetical protein